MPLNVENALKVRRTLKAVKTTILPCFSELPVKTKQYIEWSMFGSENRMIVSDLLQKSKPFSFLRRITV